MTLSPSEIHEWIETYELSPSWVWKAIEDGVDTDINDIHNSDHIFTICVNHLIDHDLFPFSAMRVGFKPIADFLTHTVPVLVALLPHMDREQRQEVHNITRNTQITDMINALMSTY